LDAALDAALGAGLGARLNTGLGAGLNTGLGAGLGAGSGAGLGAGLDPDRTLHWKLANLLSLILSLTPDVWRSRVAKLDVMLDSKLQVNGCDIWRVLKRLGKGQHMSPYTQN